MIAGLWALVPKWLLAVLLAASVAHGLVSTGQRNSARSELQALQVAVSQQKAEASAALAEAGGRILAAERDAAEARAQQELRDAKATKIIQKQSAELIAMSRAGGGSGLRDPNATDVCRGSSPGTDTKGASYTNDRPADTTETFRVLSGPLEELLLKITREADEINNAYAGSAQDGKDLRKLIDAK